MNDRLARFLLAVVLSLGIAFAGWAIGRGIMQFRTGDRYVSVKGVSEREVKADLALWPLQLSAADNDLSMAQARISGGIRQTLAFLAKQGIDTGQVQLQVLRVTDRDANPYQPANQGGRRFIINQTLIVRSTEPDKIVAASQRVGELVAAGVVLSSGPEYGASGPEFLFTKLNDIKPAMIAEATGRAREAAEQFARDAGSRVSGIRQANQGVFQILPRDQAPGISEGSQVAKTVRVVSTVDYFLRD